MSLDILGVQIANGSKNPDDEQSCWYVLTRCFQTKYWIDQETNNPFYSFQVIVFQPNVPDHNEKKRQNLPPAQLQIP